MTAVVIDPFLTKVISAENYLGTRNNLKKRFFKCSDYGRTIAKYDINRFFATARSIVIVKTCPALTTILIFGPFVFCIFVFCLEITLLKSRSKS